MTTKPVRFVFGGQEHYLTLEQARATLTRLQAAIEIAEREASPPTTPEPPTSPGTGEARRRSSDKLQAVRLPEPGLDARVAELLRVDEDPPKSSP